MSERDLQRGYSAGMTTAAEVLSVDQVSGYLARIGVTRQAPDVETLRELHLRHLQTVPFENLDIHLDRRISLAVPELYVKIVERKRGGFCYELNGLFGALLRGLGYDVAMYACRVQGSSGLGPLFDHLALSVAAPDSSERWLADVGFGRHSAYPLRLGVAGDQHDPNGVFRVEARACGDVDVLLDGAGAVPDRDPATRSGRLRSHVLVATDLAGLALPRRAGVLAAHRLRRDDHSRRPCADQVRERRAHRDHTCLGR